MLKIISLSNKNMLHEVSHYADYLQIQKKGFTIKPCVFNLASTID